MHIGPLFDYSIDDRQPVFAGKSMIDTFFLKLSIILILLIMRILLK